MCSVNKAQLEAWCAAVLMQAGVDEQSAETTARILIRTDCRGIRTHGITRLLSYLEKIKSGEVNAQAKLGVVQHDAMRLSIQADGALGQVAMTEAVDRSLALLQTSPIVITQIYECGHLGALGVYALQAAEAGAFCLLVQRTPPLLAMQGFDAPAIGNNPLAYACPIDGQAPLVFDMACSVAARGHILLKARQGEPIPEGWALSRQGKPTTDATEALQGALLPSAAHKGLGLAMLVECLAGGLTATESSINSLNTHTTVPLAGAQGRQNAFMLLLNPTVISQGLFQQYMQTWVQSYYELGGSEARLSGSRGDELERQVEQAGYVELDHVLYTELVNIGEKEKLPFPKG